MNVLLDETKGKRIDLGLSMLPMIRMSPTLAALLEQEKAADDTWAVFFTRAALVYVFMRRIMAVDLPGVIRLGVSLVAIAPDEASARPLAKADGLTNVRTPAERQRRRA